MKAIIQTLLANKSKTVPVLSFPSTQLMGITVQELISSAENQAKGMKAIAERCPIGASLNMMDLSVEAEAFGCPIKVSDHENPTVSKGIVSNEAEINALKVPEIGAGRTKIYIDGVKKAKERIADIPVFCGVIGPYSLAGRLYDMTELMMSCYDAPEMVRTLLEKCTDFIIRYIKAFQLVGADGIVLAEPAAGLLSPDLCAEFSVPYVKRIVAETSNADFAFVYHNCGNTIPLIESILTIDADAYHFGNAIALHDMLPLVPQDKLVMGNVNPVSFRSDTPEQIREQTLAILEKCSKFPHFTVSSGCDIPADVKWENIDAYFAAVQEFYQNAEA